MEATKTEQTVNGLAKYSTDDFRTYAPKRTFCAVVNAYIWSQLCEELVDGRWEPFVSTHMRQPEW